MSGAANSFADAAWFILGAFILLEGIARFERKQLVGLRRIYWGVLIILWATVLDLTAEGSPLRWLVFVTSIPLAPLFYLGVKPVVDKWWPSDTEHTEG